MPYDSDRQRGFMHAQHPGIARRWDKEEHDAKRRKRSSNVGKRMSGGSFDSGPSTIVRGVARQRVRRNTTLARYAGTPGHGKRYGPEPGLEVYRGRSTVAKGVFSPTSVLSRAGKLGETLQGAGQQVMSGIKAGQAGNAAQAGSAVGRGGKALVATGQKLGQATATPMRAATTGGAIGATGTVAAQTAVPGQKDPNGVGKAALHISMSELRIRDPQARARISTTRDRALRHRAHGARQSLREFNRAGDQRLSEAQRSVHKADRERGVMVTRLHGSSPRNYDPEAQRQRRLGSSQGVANTVGAAGVAGGAAHLRELNRKAKVTARDGTSTGVRRAIAVNRRGGAMLGGGLAALAVGEKVRRHANDPRNRAWR
jgi:hypothetical protein